jgi:branched-chain amino acid transport system permease protein
MIELIPQVIFNGLLVGANYALIAVGLTMIFGIMNIANFAHGELYALGACVVLYVTTQVGLSYLAALPLTVVFGVLLGVVLERLIFRRLRDKQPMSSLLATIGLALILQNILLVLWGPQPRKIPTDFSPMPVIVGPIFTTEVRIFALGVTLVALLCLHLFLTRSVIGTAIRAMFQQREAALLVGIPLDRINAITFGLGSGLAALGGGLIGAIFFVDPTMGGPETLKAFIVVILGGLGSVPGSMIGGLILGVAESLGTLVSSAYKDAIGFILVILILLYKPDGLFKR